MNHAGRPGLLLPFLAGLCVAANAGAQTPPPKADAPALLAPLAADGAPPPPWRVAGLPAQPMPMTRFAVVTLEGRHALRIDAEASYGNLVHPVSGGTHLSWRWRLEQPIAGADLRRKEGDDAALKVCAMFDLPLDALPFWERQKMRMARAAAGEALPAATLCYVWDPALPAGTVLPNAYTPRLRWLVLQGRGSALGGWQAEARDLQADFRRVFDDTAPPVPPLAAIAVGADADNTGGRSLGFVADLALTR